MGCRNIPSTTDFSDAMSFLPHREHSSIIRFLKLDDRKRALVSRLLQYGLVHKVLGIPFDEIIIRRTPEGKPFLACDNMKLGFPNFNFNVSHHAHEFARSFSSYFTSLEWYHIFNTDSSDEMLKTFYRYWCLKEAFVKAMGSGVGYKLDEVEFHHTNWDNIFVKVGGKEVKDWKFWLLQLGLNHSVSIARGHPKDAITKTD